MRFACAFFRMPGRAYWRIDGRDLPRLGSLPSVPARGRTGCRIGKGFAKRGAGFSEGTWIAFEDPDDRDARGYRKGSHAWSASILCLAPAGDPRWIDCDGLPIFAPGREMEMWHKEKTC